jgi:hypothetical protein
VGGGLTCTCRVCVLLLRRAVSFLVGVLVDVSKHPSSAMKGGVTIYPSQRSRNVRASPKQSSSYMSSSRSSVKTFYSVYINCDFRSTPHTQTDILTVLRTTLNIKHTHRVTKRADVSVCVCVPGEGQWVRPRCTDLDWLHRSAAPSLQRNTWPLFTRTPVSHTMNLS